MSSQKPENQKLNKLGATNMMTTVEWTKIVSSRANFELLRIAACLLKNLKSSL